MPEADQLRALFAARKFLESAAPVLSKPDAEAYQKRAVDDLKAALDQTAIRER